MPADGIALLEPVFGLVEAMVEPARRRVGLGSLGSLLVAVAVNVLKGALCLFLIRSPISSASFPALDEVFAGSPEYGASLSPLDMLGGLYGGLSEAAVLCESWIAVGSTGFAGLGLCISVVPGAVGRAPARGVPDPELVVAEVMVPGLWAEPT